nr:carbamoyltransferase HypF [bacterium]
MNKILTERKKGRQKEKSKRLFIDITGIVQGVGFRPFIYSLATRFSLSGFVLNDTSGIKIEIEGEEKKIAEFLEHVTLDAPPLALIEKIDCRKLPPIGYHHFEIKKSKKEKEKFTLISPDISICPDCLRELFDKADRRYQYSFINCTNCGPRFSIIKNIPYDRFLTTMKEFKMCPECQSEYDDPLNRRFHAQPNACEVCGPRVSLFDSQGRKIHTSDPIKKAASLLKKGYIIAVKGLGGFHLACDAANKASVEALRKRKYREDKPFALMALDIKKIKEFCQVNEYEQRLLLSPRRPILILRKKKDCWLPDEIAPHNKYLGMMLPYTPLHYLLLREAGMVLVMTSGNICDEPIVYKNKEN